jgi:hypothetical protein
MTDKALYEYDFGADSNGGKYFVINPGEVMTLKIATWIEYDFVKEELEKGGVPDGYDVEISLIATQDVDGALER